MIVVKADGIINPQLWCPHEGAPVDFMRAPVNVTPRCVLFQLLCYPFDDESIGRRVDKVGHLNEA